MGWWKIEGTENTIGDGPLDTLGAAIESVISDYRVAMNRKPTRAEWEALLRAVLGATEIDQRVLDEGVVRRVVIESD
jgi:hypothetical protein